MPLACYTNQKNRRKTTSQTAGDDDRQRAVLTVEEISEPIAPDVLILSPTMQESQAVAAAGPSTDTTVEGNDIEVENIQIATENERSLSGNVRRKGQKTRENKEDAKRKQLCSTGNEYVSKRGSLVKEKKVGKQCPSTCKKECSKVISGAQRKEIFDSFWKLGETVKQWEYIGRFVKEVPVKFRRSGALAPKSTSRQYSLFDGNSNQIVCKQFFLCTLDISEAKVITALRKKNPFGNCEEDKRGSHKNRPWALGEEKEEVKQHIGSFATVDSHYCRKKSKRQYLDPSLSIQHMHRLYTAKRKSEGAQRISGLTEYKEVFYKQFNLGFHRPKNDICETCSKYDKSVSLSPEDYTTYQNHREEASLVRDYKDHIKIKSKETSNVTGATFDLEEVLQTPKSTEGILYYKRKLNNYNLSIFDFKSAIGYNYLWNEANAKRGANDIASCVYHFLMDMSGKGMKSVTLFSDSCGGQNRNRFFLSMMWYVIQNSMLLEIEHVFFVRGHSENESDSIHARIEKASKPISVYTTPQWATVIRGAKRTQPLYQVKEMSQDDFFDFKLVEKKLMNTNLDTERHKIQWMKIRKYVISNDAPNIINIFYELNGTPVQLNVEQKIRKRTSDLSANFPLHPAYSQPLPLSSDKYKDLTELCDNGIIPSVHHPFYKALPHGQVDNEDDQDEFSEDE